MNNKSYPTRNKRNKTSSLSDTNNPKVSKILKTTHSSITTGAIKNSSNDPKLNEKHLAIDKKVTPRALSTFNCMPIHSSRLSNKYKRDNSKLTNKTSTSTSTTTDRRTKHGRNVHFLHNCLNAIAPSQSPIQRNTSTIPALVTPRTAPTDNTNSSIHDIFNNTTSAPIGTSDDSITQNDDSNSVTNLFDLDELAPTTASTTTPLSTDPTTQQHQYNPDESMYQQQQFNNKYPKDTVLLTGQVIGLKLKQILDKHNIAQGAYDEVKDWFMQNHQQDHPVSIPSLKSLKTDMTSMYRLESLFPTQHSVRMPSGTVSNLVTINPQAALMSLLNDSDLMREDNLLFKGQNPLNPVSVDNPEYYDDIDTGSWYKCAEEHVQKMNIPKAIPLPIICFFDGTTIDQRSALTMYPFMITLGIFNRKTRQLPEAWRLLGFVPDTGKSYSDDPDSDIEESATIGKLRLKDLHFSLSQILQPFLELQQKGGFKWSLNLHGNDFDVTFVPQIQFIIGDCEEHNKLAGRYGKHSGLRYLVRDCFCKSKDSSNPFADKCAFIKNSILQRWEQTQQFHKLTKRNFHFGMKNILHRFSFGGDAYGLNGALPPELLHLYQLKFCDLLVDQFRSLFSDINLNAIQINIQYLITRSYHQCDRSFPNIQTFKTGLKVKKNLTGTERYAQVFAIYLFLLTTNGCMFYKNKQIDSQSEAYHHSYKSFITLVENILIMYQWLNQKKFPVAITKEQNQEDPTINGTNPKVIPALEVIRGFMLHMQLLLSKVKNWEFPKYHQLLHLVTHYIPRFGSMRNVDGAPCESNFKQIIKNPSRRTQQHAETLPFQTANRHTENIVFDKAFRRCSIGKYSKRILPTSSKHLFSVEDSDITISIPTTSSFFTVSLSNRRKSSYEVKWHCQRPMEDHPVNVYQKLCEMTFATDLNLTKLICFTELKIGDIIIRAHPSYRSGIRWFDWIYVKWEGYDKLFPAKVLMFVSLGSVNGVISEDMSNIKALIQTTSEIDTTIPNELKNRMLCEYYKYETTFQLVSISAIDAPAFVIENVITNKETNETSCPNVIVIKPIDKWATIYNSVNSKYQDGNHDDDE